MNILLLGSGGREHALAWKMSQSLLCNKLYIAPGNAGTESCGENVALDIKDFAGIGQFCRQNAIELLVVGPEDPLVNGIHDHFLSDPFLSNITVIGPPKEGAQLEGSKSYAKQFMLRHQIPTAAYQSFTADNIAEGLAYIDQQNLPIVLKADGLAAGKGVLICEDHATAKAEFEQMLGGKFGDASANVVIESFLSGIEFSVFILTDGKDYKILPTAKDYKRVGEGDTGLNTGGMGAVSPVPFATEELMQKVEERVIQPTINGLQKDGIPYSGFLYIGLMNVEGDPYVIEYNIRMGDPETQVVIPRITSDLVAHFEAIGKGTLANETITIDEQAATTVVLASGGYPGSYEKGKVIKGLYQVSDGIVFHAGTMVEGDEVKTNGGRVLAVTGMGPTIADALSASNKNAAIIKFDQKYYRKDIGLDLIIAVGQ